MQECLERGQWSAPSPQDIVNSYRGGEVQLRAEDVILQVRRQRAAGVGTEGWARGGPALGGALGAPPRAAARGAAALPCALHPRLPCAPQPPPTLSHAPSPSLISLPLSLPPLPVPLPSQENKIDYSAKEKNPLDAVHFFDRLDSTHKRKLRPEQISSFVVAYHQV